MTTRTNLMRVSGCLLVAVLAIGCSSRQQPTRVSDMLGNMSPDFETIALSHDQRLVRQARSVDVNLRQLTDDIDNVLLIYRPLRLSIYPIP